jgi:dTDP-4-dehydrorhamnose reductase
MKILLTGGNGQLAYDIKKSACSPYSIISLTHQECDITQSTSINNAIASHKPDFIINTAAYTAVDKAEIETETARRVNQEACKLLAISCKKHHIPLIHLSTDYVFDGQSQLEYTETDTPNPLNYYGLTKLKGEQEIQHYCTQYIILRVCGVFGIHGQNFVKTMLRLGKEREILSVVNDQITCPTPANDIALTVLTIMSQLKTQFGIYHYCSTPIVSWYDFATEIFEIAKQYPHYQSLMKLKEIKPIHSDQYPTAAKRPAHAILNCDKIKSTFSIQQPSWKAGLEKVIHQYLTEKNDV